MENLVQVAEGQVVTMNTNAKKSYSSIGTAPFQGLRLTAYCTATLQALYHTRQRDAVFLLAEIRKTS